MLNLFKSRKGQYLTLEQFIVFLIGIIITLSIFVTFTSIRDKIEKTSKKDQLREAGHFVISNILNVYMEEESKITHTIDVPKKIAGKNYQMKVGNDNLNVFFSGKKNEGVSLSLEGMDKNTDIFGMVYSSRGKIKITKRNNNIILRRV